MVSYRPDGRLYDTRGVEVDVEVPVVPTDLIRGGSDSALEAAERLILGSGYWSSFKLAGDQEAEGVHHKGTKSTKRTTTGGKAPHHASLPPLCGLSPCPLCLCGWFPPGIRPRQEFKLDHFRTDGRRPIGWSWPIAAG